MNRKSILTLMFITGCNAGDVAPPDIQGTDTDGGLGDTGDTDTAGSNPDECWLEQAPPQAVRWQCEGLAEAAIMATLDVDIPNWADPSGFWQQVIDYGRLDWAALFGPWNGEAYDDPGVSACCLADVGGDLETQGVDETGAEPTDDGADGGDGEIPQAAVACTRDCADQACREIPRRLRDMAAEVPWGIPLSGPSYRDQLLALADWVAANHLDCYDSMIVDGVHESLGAYVIDGEWQIPNSNDWPDVTELSVDGQCKVFDWYLPEQGEPQACTGINDDNHDDPFGSGSSLGGFDTFVPTTGEMRLDGPELFGMHAAGSAPILGLGDACPRGECSRLDAWVTNDTLELRRLVLVAPSALRWQHAGMQLTVDGLHAMVEHPLSIPLVADGDLMRFEIPVGQLELLFAGHVHGVPVKLEVPNVTPVTGVVLSLFDGSHGIAIDPFTVEHRDAHGTWAMHVALGELVALEHAPRATFEVHGDGDARRLDASASFDPDGDALSFAWFRDGTLVGEGPVLASEPAAGEPALSLRVTDDAGRAAWRSSPSSDER